MREPFLMDIIVENTRKLIELDPLFGRLLNEYGMPVFSRRPEGFESLCRTVLEQQVSLNSAKASHIKLQNATGGLIPENLLQLTDEQLRHCGISRQKSLYLREIAGAIINGSINPVNFSAMDADEVRNQLIKIKGVGNWTVDIYMMFSLRSPDILPLGDIGIVSAIKDLTGLSSANEIIDYTKNWAPYRTTASFFLWHYYLEKRGRKFPH